MYSILAVLFASGALVDIHNPPSFEGLGALVSVLPVVATVMQLSGLTSPVQLLHKTPQDPNKGVSASIVDLEG